MQTTQMTGTVTLKEVKDLRRLGLGLRLSVSLCYSALDHNLVDSLGLAT